MAEEKTRVDLVTRVLDLLGVTAEGINPSAEQVNQVDINLDTILSSLALRRIVYIANSDAIPLGVFEELAVLVADAMDVDFGVSGALRQDNSGTGTSRYDRAVNDLRIITQGTPSYGPQKVEWF